MSAGVERFYRKQAMVARPMCETSSMTRIAQPLPTLRILMLFVAVLAACGDNLPPPGTPADAAPEPVPPDAVPPDAVPPAAGPPGVVDQAWFRARQLDYLRFATQAFAPEQPLSVIAHLERDRVDPAYDTRELSVPAGAWDPILEDMAALRDGRDFNALYVLHVLLSYRDHPMLAPALVDAVERALLDFKYWYKPSPRPRASRTTATTGPRTTS